MANTSGRPFNELDSSGSPRSTQTFDQDIHDGLQVATRKVDYAGPPTSAVTDEKQYISTKNGEIERIGGKIPLPMAYFAERSRPELEVVQPQHACSSPSVDSLYNTNVISQPLRLLVNIAISR